MKKFSGKVTAVVVLLLCLLYLGYRIYDSRSYAATLREETLKPSLPPYPSSPPSRCPRPRAITLPGTIQGWYEATTYARVTGYVHMWHKKYGDWVRKGDLLAEISTPDLDAEYRQAIKDLESQRAKYRLAEVTAQRWRALRPNHAVSEQAITVKEQELRAQAAVVEAAHHQVKNVEAFIGFKRIIAPFDGVVVERNINVGDLVSKQGTLHTPNAKTNLYTVAVIDKLRLFIKVPAYFGPVPSPKLDGRRDGAAITQSSLDRQVSHGLPWIRRRRRGRRLRSSRSIMKTTRSGPVPTPSVHLTAPVDRSAFVIPTSALVYEKDDALQAAVLTEDNRAHFKPITVSNLMDSAVEVSAGLSASDRLIDNPLHTLLEGDQVRIVKPRPGYEQRRTPEESEGKATITMATTD